MTKLTIEVSEEEMQMVLDKRKEQKETQTVRFPAHEPAFFIARYGGVYMDFPDICFTSVGNDFKTKADAEYVAKHHKQYRAMFHFANERGGVQEFVYGRKNYHPMLDSAGRWVTGVASASKAPGIIYMTKKDADLFRELANSGLIEGVE